MHYYTFNIADYRKDTGHLSTLEHGIYRQLLDWYYLDEVPIPIETQTVIRRLRLGSDSDIQSLQNVLSDFFVLQDDGYHQLRCDDQIEKYHDKAEVNKVNGKLGGRPKKTQSVIFGNPTQSESKANETLTNNHKPITINQEPIKPPLPPKGELFEVFWKAYPKKVGKDAAYKAFAKRKPDELLVKTMIASVRKQADTEQWKKDGGQFIPHASTWLNEGRWQDETEIGAEQDWRITRKGVEDMAEKLGLGRWNQMCQFDQYRNSVVTEATQRGMT